MSFWTWTNDPTIPPAPTTIPHYKIRLTVKDLGLMLALALTSIFTER